MTENYHLQKTAKEYDRDQDISWSIGHTKENSHKSRSARQEIFHFLVKLQNQQDCASEVSLFKVTILKMIFSFQFASLAWYQVANHDSVKEFWNFASYLRFDNIFSDLGLIECYLYIATVIVWGYYILVLMLYILWRLSQNVSNLLWRFEKTLN